MSFKPKIAYFGSDEICLPGLRYLHEQAELCELAIVVSQPDRRQGRGKKLQPNPVSVYAMEQGLTLLQPEKPGDHLAQTLSDEGIVLAFVMAYGHFLKKTLREAPFYGIWNFHGSMLPAYRGASPVETAIAMGDLETGVCLMRVVREMDAGAVADCEKVRIEDSDTAPVVRAKVGDAVVPLLERNLEAALKGELRGQEQEHGLATFCRKISREDAALDFTLPARMLDSRLRAFRPWPGGYFDHAETRIKVGQVSWIPVHVDAVPGTVVATGNTLDVATGEGVLQIAELQRPGGRMLPVKDFLRGYCIHPEEVLPSVVAAPLVRSISL